MIVVENWSGYQSDPSLRIAAVSVSLSAQIIVESGPAKVSFYHTEATIG
jgi:hypothetical protein